MKKKFLIIFGILLVVVGLAFLISGGQSDDVNSVDSIHAASEGSGFISEKVIGNPNTAKLVVYEYADYGCSHCADWNRKINDLINKYGDKLALVFRAYDIGFNNGALASKAATAAQLQGYFREYKDLLFSNQSEWMYADNSNVENIFSEYFKEVSSGHGDMDKFKNDLRSEAVRKRVNFEHRMGERAKVKGTPMFRIDGEMVELSKLVETIEQKIS